MCRDRRFIAITTTIVLLLGALPAIRCGSLAGQEDIDREEQLAAGKNAFRDNCLMCHAEEMTARLRLTEKQWAAEIDKMIGWGAPVPPELKAPLLDYLISAFSNPATAPVAPPERIAFRDALALVRPESTPAPGSGAGDGSRGVSLYATNCATCHGPAAAGGDLGTCLVEKPVLLRPAEYTEVVRKGRRRMPGFAAALKPEQEADILVWLRTLRFGQ
jgi:ubiquinol-cytochrome c reductase cytochrome c subunit